MAVLDLSLEREVGTDPRRVWGFVVEEFFANHRKWDPAIVDLTPLTEGPVGPGTRGREVRSFGGRQAAEFLVTRFEPETLFAFVNATGPFALERAYSFRPSGPGCRMVFRFTMRPKGAMRLFFPVLRGLIARQVAANIDRLCGLLAAEGQSREAEPARLH